jgi:cobalt transporter subunit CbtB
MQNEATIVFNRRTETTSTRIRKPLQLTSAFILGVIILYAAGFAQTSAVHNAAHDMRHSHGFPCH